MVLIQIDVPADLDKMLQIERIQREHITKAETVVEIINEYFKPFCCKGDSSVMFKNMAQFKNTKGR